MKKSIVLRLALFSLIVNYLHVKKDSALHFINLEYPFHKDALYKVWLNLGKWFLRRRQKCKKLQTDERTDKRTGGRQTTSDIVCREKYLRKFKNWDLYRFMLISPILIFKFSLLKIKSTQFSKCSIKLLYVMLFWTSGSCREVEVKIFHTDRRTERRTRDDPKSSFEHLVQNC